MQNGVERPRLGIGVYGWRKGRETQRVIVEALGCGYRLIDTAKM